jgi:hypothetical protein
VWKIFEEDAREAEERVFAVIEGGAVLGRDRVDIARDLEALIRYKDGGSRVIGRWGAMVSPYKTVTVDGKETIIRDVKAVAQGWEREYINHLNESKGISPGDEGWIGYGSKEERELFRDPKELADKQAWIDQHSTGKRGRTLLPPGAREYVNRIGKSGLDYRAIRVTRTESSVRFNERQRDIARNSPAATGLVERKLAPQRDGWKCACVDAYKRINENGGMRPDEIPEEYQAPLHPNCLCHDMPVMRPMKEVREEIMKQYFGEDYAKQTV